MRKNRIIFWVISFIVCVCIIVPYKKIESRLPEEQKEPISVYCEKEFKSEIKNIIGKSSIGDTHRVVFSDEKDDAAFILTDEILASDSGYEKIGWSPVVVVFGEDKYKDYKESGYMIKENDAYTIKFDKVINDTISGKWKEKIYCPKPDTKYGQIFFDFLLVNVNNGRYPKQEELENATQKANQFLNCDIVEQVNSLERIKAKKDIQEGLYIAIENDLYYLTSSLYDFEISYPSNTICYELYFKLQGKNEEALRKILEKKALTEWGTRLENVMYDHYIRNNAHSDAYSTDYFKESDGFSYVEVPFKEE